MRETMRLSLVGVLLSLGLPPALAQTGIPWLYDIFQAQQIARQEQRLLLLHFYSDACAPCRRLEQNVFPNPEVYRAMSLNYIPVKINGERARDIARQYQVDRWPTDVITDPQGRILYKTVSPQDPVRYVQLLNAVSADFRAAGPPPQFAVSPPPQGSPGAGSPYAVYDNRMDGRSQFAAYAPSERGAPLESATAGTYGGQAERQSYGGTAPMPPQNALGDSRWQQGPSYGDPYAASGPALTSARPDPDPREQLNPYAAPYAAAPTAGASSQAGGYDPRSSWSPPGGSYGGPASGSAEPPMPPAQGSFASNQPAWQENRFVSDRAAAETPRVAAAPQAPASSGAAGAPTALDGFCAVTLAEQERWVKGDPRWGAVHRGRTYLFLSQQHQQRFLADPDRYSPVLSGYDPTRYVDRGEVVPGQRRHGMWFRGKIYLFADEDSLERFSAAPEGYAQRAHQIMMAAGRN